MKRSRWIVVIALGAAVVLAIAYGFMAKAVPADMTTVSRGPLTVTVEEEGKTRVKDRYTISAPVSGFQRRIFLDAGDPVRKGQIVAELEPLRSEALDPRSRAEAEAAVAAAEASVKAAEERLRAAEAEAAYAKANHERTKQLYDAGYAALDNLEQSGSEAKRTEANRLSAEASMRVAVHQLDRARNTLKYSAAEDVADSSRITRVRSPVSGSVLKLHRESEGVVHSGDPLIDVGDPANIEVEVEVLSADAVSIRPGTRVYFERWGGSPALEGRVRVVEPGGFTKISSLGVEEQRVLVIADIRSVPENWKGLADRYRVEARFVIWEGKEVLQVPASALFRKGEGWAVFVVRNGRAREQAVEIGRRTGLAAEIRSGLSAGEIVITHPDDAITDGARVRKR